MAPAPHTHTLTDGSMQTKQSQSRNILAPDFLSSEMFLTLVSDCLCISGEGVGKDLLRFAEMGANIVDSFLPRSKHSSAT